MLINARELKKIILDKNNFSRWIKENIKKHNLIDQIDYFTEEKKVRTTSNLKMIKREYYLTEKACQTIIYFQKRSKKTEIVIKRIEGGESLEKIISELSGRKEEKEFVIKFDDEDYPEQLRKIENPPKQLYVKGNIRNLKESGIAVIGTRDCSNYGRKICKIFANNLTGYNLNIISGLATGIDTCAHKACIDAKGKTIAVLPSGLDNIYPKENEELLKKILSNGGTVVSEYPPEFEKTQESCRQRNRIMSGLAIATLVVEAGHRSGTSITVRYANEQNKKVFCIPASLENSKGIGTNKMIKENRAKLITDVEDIIKEFPELNLERNVNFNFRKIENGNVTKKKEKKSKINVKIDEENLEIYNFLQDSAKAIDEIERGLNKPIDEITYKLTLLELQGVIEQMPGKKFKVK